MKQLKNFGIPDDETADALDRYGDTYRDAMKQYGDMDEDALIGELMKSIATAKSNGSYDAERMLGMISTMSPYLNDAQKARLEKVISLID